MAHGVPDAELAPTLAAGAGHQVHGSFWDNRDIAGRLNGCCSQVVCGWLFAGFSCSGSAGSQIRLVHLQIVHLWVSKGASLVQAEVNAGGLNHNASLGMGETAQSGGASENGRAEGVSCLETESFCSEAERAQKGVG